MEVHALPSACARAAGPLWRHAPRLVELCGTPGFESALFAAARETARCEHVTAFAFGKADEPRIVVAANAAERPVARQVGRKYVRDYWKLDPAHKAQAARPRPAGDPHPRRGHRQRRLPARLLHRRRIVRPDFPGQHPQWRDAAADFYKSSCNGCFADEEIDHLLGPAELMLSLLAKHDAGVPLQGADAALKFRQRLQMFAMPLPKRELEVCTLGAERHGMSSEGIGLELGVGLNTVLTHRKRAYARLGISSQNELLRLLLS